MMGKSACLAESSGMQHAYVNEVAVALWVGVSNWLFRFFLANYRSCGFSLPPKEIIQVHRHRAVPHLLPRLLPKMPLPWCPGPQGIPSSAGSCSGNDPLSWPFNSFILGPFPSATELPTPKNASYPSCPCCLLFLSSPRGFWKRF